MVPLVAMLTGVSDVVGTKTTTPLVAEAAPLHTETLALGMVAPPPERVKLVMLAVTDHVPATTVNRSSATVVAPTLPVMVVPLRLVATDPSAPLAGAVRLSVPPPSAKTVGAGGGAAAAEAGDSVASATKSAARAQMRTLVDHA